ncbi:hypothetical protein AWV79_35430 [Cupriavidus sp. UYMMa02A]|nr:hypothetical protein AWV79_35430 [Cupriavidus sp. UYMMa02A]
MDFVAVAQQCAPNVAPQTLMAVARVESSFNPYAIGVVGGRLERQPRSHAEAVATARQLERLGYNFSMGATQVNRYNLAKYNESYDTIFDLCRNLRTGAAILEECFVRAKRKYGDDQAALRAAFSCYYSGNYVTGFQHGYVQKVVSAALQPAAIGVVPTVARPGAAANASPSPPADVPASLPNGEPVDMVSLKAKSRAAEEGRASMRVKPIPGNAGAKGSLKYEMGGADEADDH